MADANAKIDFKALIAQKDSVVNECRDREYKSIVNESKAIQTFNSKAWLPGTEAVLPVAGCGLCHRRHVLVSGDRNSGIFEGEAGSHREAE